MKEKESGGKMGEKVAFAGAKYDVERMKTERDAKRESVMKNKTLGGAC